MDFTQAAAILASRSQDAARQCECAGARALECEPDPPPPPPPPASLRAMPRAALLRVLLQQQEARVRQYRLFEEGFALFLQVADEAQGYEALVASSTAAFAEISAAVVHVEEELRERAGAGGGPEASAFDASARLVRRIQELEREKLSLTAQLQIVRHGIAIDQLRQSAVEESGEEEARLHARERQAAALRQDEAAELTGKLARLVDELNDALDDVRCEVADADDAD